jgi:hypothetical protein
MIASLRLVSQIYASQAVSLHMRLVHMWMDAIAHTALNAPHPCAY